MMFRRAINCLLLAIGIVFFLSAACFAQAVSSDELIKNAKDYDGKSVLYRGEVIGDVMVRGKYAWINVNDGKNAIGIWIDKDLAKDILFTGNYKTRGDQLEIAGVFQRSCLEHGGDLDIHAKVMRKISAGAPALASLNTAKTRNIFILTGVLILVWILSRLNRA
jgi:hypothetical protein